MAKPMIPVVFVERFVFELYYASAVAIASEIGGSWDSSSWAYARSQKCGRHYVHLSNNVILTHSGGALFTCKKYLTLEIFIVNNLGGLWSLSLYTYTQTYMWSKYVYIFLTQALNREYPTHSTFFWPL